MGAKRGEEPERSHSYIGEDTSGQGRAWVAGHRIIQLNNTDCINT